MQNLFSGMPKLKHISIIGLLILLYSCSDYQKLLKSSDYELKYTKAVEYYNNEDYFRALSLFEELMTIYKGTKKAENIYYYYCYCQYNEGHHVLAGYHFKNFARTYPNSTHKEEALFQSAYCQYLNSPEYSLDQSYTYKAIDELQLFINKYPNSEHVKKSNELIEKLREKLEKKAFYNAKLYYDIKDYKAAIVALKNSLKDFPDSKFREEQLFLILKSSYLLAENSIEKLKKERFDNTITEYYAFIDEYANSEKIKNAERIYANTINELEKIKQQ